MKKQLVKFTLMLLAIALGVSNAFAEDVYTKTGKADWIATDVADWGTTNLSVTEKTALVLSGKGNISASHDFSFKTQDPLVTLVAEFKAGNDCADAESYDYFTFGGITFKFNRVGKTNSGYFKLVADNEEKTFDGTPESLLYTITIVVDQVEDKASYTLDYKDNVIASGIVNTKTELKTVKFGHYTTNQNDNNTLTLQSLQIKENPGVELTLNNNYIYSTFCSDWNIDFSTVTAVEAYKANVNGNVVSTERVYGKVKAGEGLLIKNVANVTSVTLPVVHDAEALENNALKGVIKNMEASDFKGKNAYILASDTEFKHIDPAKSTGTFKKGKAYLELPAGTSAKPSTLFIGEATAINGIAVEKKADNAIYNLQGMRVKTPTKGLYIINGKKYRF